MYGLGGGLILSALFLVISFFPEIQKSTSYIPESTSYPLPDKSPTQLSMDLIWEATAYPQPVEPTRQEKIKPPLCENIAIPDNNNFRPLEFLSISDPEIIFENSNPIGIVDWLPDNQNILISLSLLNGYENINSLNVVSKDNPQVTKRQISGNKPIWLTEINSLIYSDLVNNQFDLIVLDRTTNKISDIAQNIYNFSLSSNGRMITFTSLFDENTIHIWNPHTNSIFLKFDMSKYKYLPLKNPINTASRFFQASWQPGGANIALFGDGYLFLLNMDSQSLCESPVSQFYKSVRYFKSAKWSPDGRYLSIISTDLGSQVATTDNELVVWDITEGSVAKVDIKSSFVYGIDWSGDSKKMAVLGREEITSYGRPLMSLFLISIDSGYVKHVQSRYPLGGGASDDWQLAWSADDRNLVIKCPLWQEKSAKIIKDRLCITFIE